MMKVSTPFGSKPGSALCRAMNVRIIRPEPTRRTKASETSAITAPSRIQRAEDAPTERPLDRRASIRSGREARPAGAPQKIRAPRNEPRRRGVDQPRRRAGRAPKAGGPPQAAWEEFFGPQLRDEPPAAAADRRPH